jgi:molecular chaperone GrpE (heat shock protein)
MADVMTPRLGKLPFWLADAALLVAAGMIVRLAGRPLGILEMVAIAGCVGIGGWLAVLPYLREHEAAVRLSETERITATVGKLNQLESLADRIAQATGQWQAVQNCASQTAEMSRGIVERLTRDAESLASMAARAADSEKQNLKLETTKLRRAEGDWLQAAAHVMDHVFALHLAAVRSAQPSLRDQMDRFHAACREALRRVGFVAVVASPDEPFDSRKHQAMDGSRVASGARIHETVAPGYMFQGRLLRPVMVSIAAPDTGGNADARALHEKSVSAIEGPVTSQNAAGEVGVRGIDEDATGGT